MPVLPYELRIIFAEEFRRQVRNKGFMFFTVLIVVVMIAAIPVTGFVVGLFEDAQDEAIAGASALGPAPDEGDVESTFGYVDPAGILPGAAKDESRIREFDSKGDGIEAVRRGEIDSLFVLPADYVESGRIEDYWTTRDRGPIWDNNGQAEGRFRGFLENALTYGRQFPPAVARAFDTGYFEQFDVKEETSAVEESGGNVAQGLVELLAFLLFGVLLMIAVMTGGGTIIRSVSEEKETRMVEMLITSASPMSILTGKLAAVVLAGLIHIAVWILVGAFATPAILGQLPGEAELTISARSLVIVSFCFVLGYVLFSRFLDVRRHSCFLVSRGPASDGVAQRARRPAGLAHRPHHQHPRLHRAQGPDLRPVHRAHDDHDADGRRERPFERRDRYCPGDSCVVGVGP